MKTLDETAFGSIRPRLRNDVVFLRVETGIYLRSAENSCVLKGAGAYEWMSVLGPRMDGSFTVDELCGSLDEKRRATAVGLIRTLLARGFARPSAQDDGDALPPDVAAAFAPQVQFVEHFMHAGERTPQELFAAFRTSRVLVAGPANPVSAAALRGLLRNGLAEVTVEDPAWKARLEPELARLEAAGTPASVSTVSDAAQEPQRYDVVLCAADLGDARPLHRLTELLLAAGAGGTRILPVLTGGRRAVIGPFTGDPEQPCWLCAQLRIASATEPALAAGLWRGRAGAGAAVGGVSGIAADMLGNAAAFDVFRLRTGQLRPDDERHAVLQDLTTLEAHRDRVLPHPCCPLPHRRAAADGTAVPAPPRDDNEAYGRVSALVHPTLGVLTHWVDEEIRQIPLKTGRARLAPSAWLSDPARVISAYDVETILAARTRAAQAAIGAYVARLGDRRRPGTQSAGAAGSARRLSPQCLDVHSGTEPDEDTAHLLPAVDLHDGSAWEVPAAAVHPLSSDNDDRAFEPTSAGVAVGWSGQEVRERGVTCALAYRGLLRALRGTEAAREVVAEALGGDTDVAFALRSLTHIGATARTFVLPGAAPAHAAVAVVEGPEGTGPDWAVGFGLDACAAVRTAVRDAAGLAVSRHTDGAAADPGDRLLADFDPRALDVGAPVEALPEDVTTLDAVLAALAGAGTRALFTETTPVDLAALRGLVTGTVLLAAT
jgi:bacteriocin biosynthesis cyclodehydratase domain-containing protein